MAIELEHSALMQEVLQITAAPGSPYHSIEVVIHAGGRDIAPLKVVRQDLECDFRKQFTENNAITVYLGTGTLMTAISPFQDDLKITINDCPMSESGYVYRDIPVASRTYRAYLGDHVESSAESSNNPTLQDMETANRTSIRAVTFILEDIAMEQFRKQSTGVMGEATPPWMVLKTLLAKHTQALQVDEGDRITKISMVAADNNKPRRMVIVPDGMQLIDLPDHIQNKQGGVYSTGLGFFIQNRIVYLWPLYDLTRFDKAPRVLRIIMAPNRQSVMIDRTWRDSERTLTIYSAGTVKVIDESLDQLNTQGNGVRYQPASQALNGMKVANNKMTSSRTKNAAEFATTAMGNGQNYLQDSKVKVTDNVCLETSKLAKRSVATLMVTWLRSYPRLLSPGMPVEILYDFNGEIMVLNGVITYNISSYEMEGRGPTAERMRAKTVLSIGVDRNSPEFLKFVKGGGNVSPNPTFGAIEVN